MDYPIFVKALKVEMKDLFVDLRQNKNEMYIRISESDNMQKNTILFPASGVKLLRDALDEALQYAPLNKQASKLQQKCSFDDDFNSRSVYVSGLEWNTTDEQFRTHMSCGGNVKSVFILRRGKLKSLSCGVVEYATSKMALTAIEILNDTVLNGRLIHCRKDRRQDADKTVCHHQISKSKVVDDRKIFCRNLSWDTTADVLCAYFSVLGKITGGEIITSKNGRHLGMGYIEFENAAHVPLAIQELDKQVLDGRVMNISEYWHEV